MGTMGQSELNLDTGEPRIFITVSHRIDGKVCESSTEISYELWCRKPHEMPRAVTQVIADLLEEVSGHIRYYQATRKPLPKGT